MGARVAFAVGVLMLAGCSSDDGEPRADPTTSPSESTASPTSQPPSEPYASTPTSPSTDLPDPPHPVSLPALMARDYDGRGLRVGPLLLRTDAYTRHAVTYRSGDLRISGIMNVPHGRAHSRCWC